MKAWKIILGVFLVALAVLLILEAVGVIAPVTEYLGGVTFWQVAGGIALLCAAASMLSAGEFRFPIVLLGFIFMIFEKNIAYACGIDGGDIVHNGLVFGCTVLVWIGLCFIFPKKKCLKIKKNKKTKDGLHITVNENELGASEIYIDCNEFGNTYMEHNAVNKIGGTEIRFENTDSYKGGATLHVVNKIGGTEIYVPRSWRLVHDIDVSLGATEIEDDGEDIAEDAPVLNITGKVSIGAIEIKRV